MTDPIDLSPNAGRFTAFADLYDRVRPSPPAVLAELLCRYAQQGRPSLVVDLGCGTGLSTRWAAGWADAVIGIDPSADMLRSASTSSGVAA